MSLVVRSCVDENKIEMTESQAKESRVLQDFLDEFGTRPLFQTLEFSSAVIERTFGLDTTESESNKNDRSIDLECLRCAHFFQHIKAIARFAREIASLDPEDWNGNGNNIPKHLSDFVDAFRVPVVELVQNERLLQVRVELDPAVMKTPITDDGKTVVEECAEKGWLWALMVWLKEDHSITQPFIEKCFIRASENGHLEVVRLLLDRGANIHACDDGALRWASHNGHLEVVRLLLERGANLRACDEYALCLAWQNRHPEVVRLLLDKGADVHAFHHYVMRREMGTWNW